MPFDKTKYPTNWEEISKYIRFERAKNKCEFCGIENYSITPRGTRVILTVAHLDHNTQNNDYSNLKALCQKCHLQYDLAFHIQNAKKTRHAKKYKNQLQLIGETP